VFVIFEGGMPLVGLALGASLGHVIGDTAEYLSGGLLIALGGYLWWADRDDDDGEVAKARRLSSARGLALVGLALSISLDELAIGFGLGLASPHGPNLVRPVIIVAAIAVQTLIASQLGLSLGSRISNRLRERIEYLISPGLACLGGYQLTGTLMNAGLVTALDTAIGAILILTLATVSMVCRPAWRSTHSVTQPHSPHPEATAAALARLGNPALIAPAPATVSHCPDVHARAWTASGASSSGSGEHSVRHVATRSRSVALHHLPRPGQVDPRQLMNTTCRHKDLSRNDANVFPRALLQACVFRIPGRNFTQRVISMNVATTSKSNFPPAPRSRHSPGPSGTDPTLISPGIAPSLVGKSDGHTGVPQSEFPELCRTDDPRGGAAAWALLAVAMALVICVLLAVASFAG
jgi:manganese efflux pump family protein